MREKTHDKPSWPPTVKKLNRVWYISRKRKKKGAEYLHHDGTWRWFAYYYETEPNLKGNQ